MKLQPDRHTSANVIAGYTATAIGVGDKLWHESLVLPWQGEPFAWDAARFEDLGPAHFERIAALRPELVIYGSGGQSDIDGLTATGHVRIKTEGQEATGGKATFDPDTLILRLSENVTVVNAQGKLNGPELTINLKTNNSVFKGNEGGRVTGVFTPQ